MTCVKTIRQENSENSFPVSNITYLGNNKIGIKDISHIEIWDIIKGERLKKIIDTDEYCLRHLVEYIRDNLFVIEMLSEFSSIKLFDFNTGIFIHTILDIQTNINSLLYIGDNILVTSVSYYYEFVSIKVCNIATCECINTIKLNQCERVKNLISLGNNNIAGISEILFSGHSIYIKIWNIVTGECLKKIQVPNISTIIYNGNNTIISSSSNECNISLWDITTGESLKTLVGHTNRVNDIVYLDNDIIASGSCDNTIKIWCLTTGKCIHTLEDHTNEVMHILYTDNYNLVSISLDNTIKIWDVSTIPNLISQEVPVAEDIVAVECYEEGGEAAVSINVTLPIDSSNRRTTMTNVDSDSSSDEE